MICAGVDAGSRTTKVVVLEASLRPPGTDPAWRLVGQAIADQGPRPDQVAREVFQEALKAAGLRASQVARVVATGYARHLVPMADEAVTEITCQARGVAHLVPGVATILEVGGQDSKLIWLDREGTVQDFAMNDRCAAGCGRFLEVVASRFGVPVSSLGRLARRQRPAPISSTCVVFAESEIIGLLAEGARPGEVVAGVMAAMASRIAGLASRPIAPPVAFTGGVALVEGMAAMVGRALGVELAIAPTPQFTGAWGAALEAGRRAGRGRG